MNRKERKQEDKMHRAGMKVFKELCRECGYTPAEWFKSMWAVVNATPGYIARKEAAEKGRKK